MSPRRYAPYESSLCQAPIFAKFGRDRPSRRRSTRLHRVRVGSGSDFAEEPAVQGVEPVTQATSRSRLSSRTPYWASRRSWRYTALEIWRLRERSASFLVLPSATLRSK